MASLSHRRYQGVLLWNDLSVCTRFGTFSALGARMQAHGFLNPLFEAQIIWSGMLDVCSTKRGWVECGIKYHEVHDSNNV